MKLQSFWKVLSEESIQIPLYQRDYAQGRYGKEALRTKFVQRLFDALRDPQNKSVKLDFVFGVRDQSSVFQPLDGQQRLTTLWLLHWYVAQKAGFGELDKVSSILQKFSYETRESSAQFCSALANAKGWSLSEKVVQFVTKQKWYFDRYELDPSVRGFLRTLETIEQCVLDHDDFKLFWDRLTNESSCPISFFVRDDMQEDAADSLYIKMNSRGKELTEFENFKADMLGLECDSEQNRLFTMDEAALVDNAWTDLFWAHQDKGEIDEIYFQFFKRYLLAWQIAETGEGGRQNPETIDEILKNDLYKHLHEGTEYVSIEPYRPALVPTMKEDLKAFFSAYGMCKKVFTEQGVDRMVSPYWLREEEEPPFTLIPRYMPGVNLEVVLDRKLLQGLPVLYSACRFLEKNKCHIEKVSDVQGPEQEELKSEFFRRFKQWMRFVWNMTEGSFASTDDTMVPLVRLLRKISDLHTWNLDEYLATCVVADIEREGASARAKALVAEIQKARLRQYERECIKKNGVSYAWAERIAHAEEIGFLHGEIEFLLPENVVDGYLSGKDAHEFDVQVKHMEMYFGVDGIEKDYAVGLAKALMKGIDRFRGDPQKKVCGFYDNEFLCRTDKQAWREVIFRDDVMSRSVARALVSNDLNVDFVPFADVEGQQSGKSGEDRLREDLLKSGILNLSGIIGPGTNSSWRFRAYQTMSFYRKKGSGKNSCSRYYFDTCAISCAEGCRRNEYLLSGEPIIICPHDLQDGVACCVPEDRYNTRFSYRETSGKKWYFSWGLDNFIRLLGDKWEKREREEDHVLFHFEYGMTRDDFINKLRELTTSVVL